MSLAFNFMVKFYTFTVFANCSIMAKLGSIIFGHLVGCQLRMLCCQSSAKLSDLVPHSEDQTFDISPSLTNLCQIFSVRDL